jgi:hypothetical protein
MSKAAAILALSKQRFAAVIGVRRVTFSPDVRLRGGDIKRRWMVKVHAGALRVDAGTLH